MNIVATIVTKVINAIICAPAHQIPFPFQSIDGSYDGSHSTEVANGLLASIVWLYIAGFVIPLMLMEVLDLPGNPILLFAGGFLIYLAGISGLYYPLYETLHTYFKDKSLRFEKIISAALRFFLFTFLLSADFWLIAYKAGEAGSSMAESHLGVYTYAALSAISGAATIAIRVTMYTKRIRLTYLSEDCPDWLKNVGIIIVACLIAFSSWVFYAILHH